MQGELSGEYIARAVEAPLQEIYLNPDPVPKRGDRKNCQSPKNNSPTFESRVTWVTPKGNLGHE